MSALVLEGQGLTMRFGGLVAMAEVDFKLHRGEILGVIGPNGAGKSTLLNIITGIYRPSSGEVPLARHRPLRPGFAEQARQSVIGEGDGRPPGRRSAGKHRH